jgi:hypothetical protein
MLQLRKIYIYFILAFLKSNIKKGRNKNWTWKLHGEIVLPELPFCVRVDSNSILNLSRPSRLENWKVILRSNSSFIFNRDAPTSS